MQMVPLKNSALPCLNSMSSVRASTTGEEKVGSEFQIRNKYFKSRDKSRTTVGNDIDATPTALVFLSFKRISPSTPRFSPKFPDS